MYSDERLCLLQKEKSFSTQSNQRMFAATWNTGKALHQKQKMNTISVGYLPTWAFIHLGKAMFAATKQSSDSSNGKETRANSIERLRMQGLVSRIKEQDSSWTSKRSFGTTSMTSYIEDKGLGQNGATILWKGFSDWAMQRPVLAWKWHSLTSVR